MAAPPAISLDPATRIPTPPSATADPSPSAEPGGEGQPPTGRLTIEPDPTPVVELRRRSLRLPIDGAIVTAMEGGFAEPRDGHARRHEAVDMLAPRDTPVHAVENGTIARVFFSKAGGNTIYQFDPAGRFCYYYAHLNRYAGSLHDGQSVSKGDVIGYVGTSGNAPPNTPHLHFAIYRLDAHKRWWQGTPIDPILVFKP